MFVYIDSTSQSCSCKEYSKINKLKQETQAKSNTGAESYESEIKNYRFTLKEATIAEQESE